MQMVIQTQTHELWRRGFIMAFLVHGLLICALFFGLPWQKQLPKVIEAEMWANIPDITPDALVNKPPSPKIQSMSPIPAPVPAPAAAPEPLPAPITQAEVRRPTEPPKPQPSLAAQPKKEQFLPTSPQVLKRLKQAQEKSKKESSKQPAAPTAPLITRPEIEKARKEHIKRMMDKLSQADTSLDAPTSSAQTSSYAAKLKELIKPYIVLTEKVEGNPIATVEVRSTPDGKILSRELLTSSGSSAWDDAVIRAIDRIEAFPKNEQGRVPSPMQLTFKPKDF